MRVHYLQHVPFETPGSILAFLEKHHVSTTSTQLYNPQQPLPELDDFDALIIMGGPMGIYDYQEYPWLKAEKQLIKSAIDADKKILGICLGAQLIADCLEARVTRNKHREIGWFDITPTEEIRNSSFNKIFNHQIPVLHWHGDTFDIPDRAIPIASSEACQNQGFIIDEQIIGLQFHMEITNEGAESLIANCQDELDGSTYVQNQNEILDSEGRFEQANRQMNVLLENFLDIHPEKAHALQ